MKKTVLGGCLIGAAWMLLGAAEPATAQVSIGIGLPNVSIGIHLPIYPELVLVPGYPVYYAPQVSSNYFFYDGMYWVYERDRWYASSWYDGPWGSVEPGYVPLYLLRVPVRYYRQPPRYFRGWGGDRPPHWGEHWGRDWERRRGGWDRWDRRSAPRAAPLPVYQRQYAGDRYPRRVYEQETVRGQRYRYEPSEPVVRQHYQTRHRAPQRASQPDRREAQGSSRQPERKQQVQQARSDRAPQENRERTPQARPRREEQTQRAAAPHREQPAVRQAAARPQGKPQAQHPPKQEATRQQDLQQGKSHQERAADADAKAKQDAKGSTDHGAS